MTESIDMKQFFFQKILLTALVFLGLLIAGDSAQADQIDDAIQILLKVKANGEGNSEAGKALKVFQSADQTSISKILKAFNQSNEYSANYLLSAFETVADNTLKQSGKLPKDNLERFILETGNKPRARRVAYEWLLKVDPGAETRMIPNMLKDPSAEFRRDSIEILIKQGKEELTQDKKEKAIATFQKSLSGAVDEDQISNISKQLKKLGIDTNLQKHFGILASWKIIGPFENREGVGYEAVYAPEKEIDLSKTYDGKEMQVKWQTISTEDDHGILNIADDIGKYKGAVMYAIYDFKSSQSQDVVLKFGTPNAWKIWVNDKLISSLEEYQRGTGFDQHKIPAKFKAGPNRILVKVCQNEQKQDWAQRFQFQIRICDQTGTAILAVK
jgi:hypothetical protein